MVIKMLIKMVVKLVIKMVIKLINWINFIDKPVKQAVIIKVLTIVAIMMEFSVIT